MAPKYIVLADDLRQRIGTGLLLPGRPLPSEVALAAEYGVNRITLRKALQVLAEDGAISRQHGKGTFVNLKSSAPTTTAPLLYVGDTTVHWHRDLYLALEREAQKRGLGVLSFSPPHAHMATRDSVHLRELLAQTSAVICASTYVRDLIGLIGNASTPKCVVCIDPSYTPSAPEAPLSSGYVLCADLRSAVRQATKYLYELGHRRIAYIGPPEFPGEPPDQARPAQGLASYRGYVDGLHEVGLAAEIVISIPGCRQEKADCILRRILLTFAELPTAFVCSADYMAAHLLRVGATLGLSSPDDFSVTGVGDTPWSTMLSPALTSVNLGETALASLAVTCCMGAMPSERITVLVAPHIVGRSSCARLENESVGKNNAG